jgi:hypothetical protein
MVRCHREGVEGDIDSRMNIFDRLTAEEIQRVKFDEGRELKMRGNKC